jgi:hypothetical protein
MTKKNQVPKKLPKEFATTRLVMQTFLWVWYDQSGGGKFVTPRFLFVLKQIVTMRRAGYMHTVRTAALLCVSEPQTAYARVTSR